MSELGIFLTRKSENIIRERHREEIKRKIDELQTRINAAKESLKKEGKTESETMKEVFPMERRLTELIEELKKGPRLI